jgi:TolB protein
MIKYVLKACLLLFLCTLISCGGNNKSGEETNKVNQPEYAIAYNVLYNDPTDNYEVFTMNLDGSQKQNITNLSGVEWTYYSFKDKLYFISDKDTCHRCFFLYATNFKGENPKQISNMQLADSWMSSRKNGQEFIVKPSPKIDSAFHIIDINGKLIQRLETGLPSSSDPLFVNGGKQVAFRGGTKKSKRIEGYKEEIYLINLDGSRLKKLTNYPESDTTAPWYAYKAGPPHLHPTENFISYASYQNGKYSLYAISLDGKKQWKLTNNELWEVYHEWSPDGNWLVMDVSNPEETHYDIGLLNWKTKEMKILTDTLFHYQQSPNFVIKSHDKD